MDNELGHSGGGVSMNSAKMRACGRGGISAGPPGEVASERW